MEPQPVNSTTNLAIQQINNAPTIFPRIRHTLEYACKSVLETVLIEPKPYPENEQGQVQLSGPFFAAYRR